MVDEFLQKASKNLEAARLCFENALYDASAGRAYFAAFQASVSRQIQSLFTRNARFEKHGGLQVTC